MNASDGKGYRASSVERLHCLGRPSRVLLPALAGGKALSQVPSGISGISCHFRS